MSELEKKTAQEVPVQERFTKEEIEFLTEAVANKILAELQKSRIY